MQSVEGREDDRGVHQVTSNLTLETGPQETGEACECCGAQSTTVHGFVYRSGDAFAVYYAGWSAEHPERGVSIAIATGDWDDGTGPKDRISIGLEARSTETEIRFSVIEPERSPWGDTQLFGVMLKREDALASGSLKPTLEIAEMIIRDDPRIGAFLGTK